MVAVSSWLLLVRLVQTANAGSFHSRDSHALYSPPNALSPHPRHPSPEYPAVARPESADPFWKREGKRALLELATASVAELTDENIQDAVAMWLTNASAARHTYGEISEWDTSRVTEFSNLFTSTNGKGRARRLFNDDISKWNTASVSSMFSLFYDSPAFNQPIGRWNVARVQDITMSFGRATAFNQDLALWNVAAVLVADDLFLSARNFNSDISNWNVASMTTVASMFAKASSFNRNIGSWNTASISSMNGVFEDAIALNQNLAAWNVASVVNVENMFKNAGAFNQDIGSWNVASVSLFSYMFTDATSFNQPVGSWNVAAATDMNLMFERATSFNQPIGTWNLASVATLQRMFFNALAFNQDISGWNVVRVSIIQGIFGAGCSSTSLSDATKRALLDSWREKLFEECPAWRALPCIHADAPPANGERGTCLSTALAVNATCAVACRAGYFGTGPRRCNADGLAGGECEVCSSGFYCAANVTRPQMAPCPGGFVCDRGTTDAAKYSVKCEARFFCPEGTATAFKRAGLCPAGFACPEGTAAGDQNQCSAGFFCDEGSSSETPCLPGTFQPHEHANSSAACIKCPVGTYSAQLNATSHQACRACGAGRTTSRAGSESESECILEMRECNAREEWEDPKTGSCKRKPEIEVRFASSTLEVTLTKLCGNATLQNATVELRLKRGDVDADVDGRITWAASVATSTPWLLIGNPMGTVDSEQPTAQVRLIIDTASLHDTAELGALTAAVQFDSSSKAIEPSNFVRQSSSLQLDVHVVVLAVAYLTLSDVVLKDSGGSVVSTAAAQVTAGDVLTITVSAVDCHRHPIPRAGQRLSASLSLVNGLIGNVIGTPRANKTQTVLLSHQQRHVYTAELPGHWIEVGRYQLRIESTSPDGPATAVVIAFDAVAPSKTALVFGSATGGFMVLLLLVGLFFIYRHRERARHLLITVAGSVLLPYVMFVLELWDLIGDCTLFALTLSMSQDAEKGRSKQIAYLVIPLWIAFSSTLVVSLLSLGIKLRLAWKELRHHRRELATTSAGMVPTQREIYTRKISKAKGNVLSALTGVAVACLENIPMTVIAALIFVHTYDVPVIVLLSFLTSSVMMGVKLSSLRGCKYWWDKVAKWEKSSAVCPDGSELERLSGCAQEARYIFDIVVRATQTDAHALEVKKRAACLEEIEGRLALLLQRPSKPSSVSPGRASTQLLLQESNSVDGSQFPVTPKRSRSSRQTRGVC